MADNISLEAREREGRGKNDARRLRAQGMVPAVLYGDGGGAGSTVLAVPTKVVDYTLQHVGDNLTLADVELPEGVELISDPEEVAATVTPPTEISDEEIEAAGIVEEPSDEQAEEVEREEGTEEIPAEERETGPAGQNLQP